jgi:hypothetical protein
MLPQSLILLRDGLDPYLVCHCLVEKNIKEQRPSSMAEINS